MAKKKAPKEDQTTMEETMEQQAAEARDNTKNTQDMHAEEAPEQAENATDDSESVDPELDAIKLKAELEASEEMNMRLKADFVNFRKRKEKEMSETVTYANQHLLKELLPVLDDFERTLVAMDKSDNLAAIKSGIEGVNRNLTRILTKIGLEPIGTEKGDVFDSNVHEAITTVDMGEEYEGKVFDIMEKGYRLRERVVRYARVVVGE